MIELKILTMIFSAPDQPAVLVLEPNEPAIAGKQRIVPIWIGANEAMQIGVALEGLRPPRPLTHDLFLNALTNLDARVDHVLINGTAGQTFFAKLYLRAHGRLIELDSRPTDAIALAVREGAPFYIEDQVLNDSSMPFIFKEGMDVENVLAEFDSFIENLTPEDLL